MILGDASHWIERFKSVDQRFTEKIVDNWAKCRSLVSPSSKEDDITNNLVNLLWRDREVRRIGWPELQFIPLEPLGNMGGVIGKGYIDIALILDNNRDIYIAYECKKLNVTYQGKRASLATPYVKEGLNRFIEQQYSRNLPMACMLGYVMDGKVEDALGKVHNAIKSHVNAKQLKTGPSVLSKVKSSERFHTALLRGDGTCIQVNHTFLSY